MIVDLTRDGTPLGIEITAPSLVTLALLNRVLKDLGYAAWYRPAVSGLWGAHIHAILIFESRTNSRGLADVGFRQIAAYDAKRDGLKSNLPDPSYRPDPKAVFTLAEYRATFAPVAAAATPDATPLWDSMWEDANTVAQRHPDGTDWGDDARAVRALAAKHSTKH